MLRMVSWLVMYVLSSTISHARHWYRLQELAEDHGSRVSYAGSAKGRTDLSSVAPQQIQRKHFRLFDCV